MAKDLNAFFERLDKDAEFKREFKKALKGYPEEDILCSYSLEEQMKFIHEIIIPFAKKHGYEFCLEDIIMEDVKNIDENRLEQVAGGANLGIKLSAGTLAAIQMLTLMSPVEAAAKKKLTAVTSSTSKSQKIDKAKIENKEANTDYGDMIEIIEKNQKTMHPISEEYPLNEVDGIIFATLSYLPMNCVPNLDSDTQDKEITISEWNQRVSKYLNKSNEKVNLHSEDEHNVKNYELNKSSKKDYDVMQVRRFKLLDILSKCPRYMNIKVGEFRGKYSDIGNKDYEQFAAVTFTLEDGTKVVSFRGTDSTLSGWKEDLDMSWSKHVPSQKDALKYLEDIYKSSPNSGFVVTGHSKGGNMAIYSAAYMCSKDRSFTDKLKSILNYDGPGLNTDIINDIDPNLFEDVNKKLVNFIPQSSVIGRIMNDTSKGKFVCVHSFSKNLFYQHDSLSWSVHRDYEKSESKFRSYEIQPESEFSADAISIFLEHVNEGNSMQIFLNWLFNFMHENNIEFEGEKTKGQMFKEIFYNYFIKGKSLKEIANKIISPKQTIGISPEEQKSFNHVMKSALNGIVAAYWKNHVKLNKELGINPKFDKSLEELIENSDASLSSSLKLLRLILSKVITFENIRKFIKKSYK